MIFKNDGDNCLSVEFFQVRDSQLYPYVELDGKFSDAGVDVPKTLERGADAETHVKLKAIVDVAQTTDFYSHIALLVVNDLPVGFIHFLFQDGRNGKVLLVEDYSIPSSLDTGLVTPSDYVSFSMVATAGLCIILGVSPQGALLKDFPLTVANASPEYCLLPREAAETVAEYVTGAKELPGGISCEAALNFGMRCKRSLLHVAINSVGEAQSNVPRLYNTAIVDLRAFLLEPLRSPGAPEVLWPYDKTDKLLSAFQTAAHKHFYDRDSLGRLRYVYEMLATHTDKIVASLMKCTLASNSAGMDIGGAQPYSYVTCVDLHETICDVLKTKPLAISYRELRQYVIAEYLRTDRMVAVLPEALKLITSFRPEFTQDDLVNWFYDNIR